MGLYDSRSVSNCQDTGRELFGSLSRRRKGPELTTHADRHEPLHFQTWEKPQESSISAAKCSSGSGSPRLNSGYFLVSDSEQAKYLTTLWLSFLICTLGTIIGVTLG